MGRLDAGRGARRRDGVRRRRADDGDARGSLASSRARSGAARPGRQRDRPDGAYPAGVSPARAHRRALRESLRTGARGRGGVPRIRARRSSTGPRPIRRRPLSRQGLQRDGDHDHPLRHGRAQRDEPLPPRHRSAAAQPSTTRRLGRSRTNAARCWPVTIATSASTSRTCRRSAIGRGRAEGKPSRPRRQRRFLVAEAAGARRGGAARRPRSRRRRRLEARARVIPQRLAGARCRGPPRRPRRRSVHRAGAHRRRRRAPASGANRPCSASQPRRCAESKRCASCAPRYPRSLASTPRFTRRSRMPHPPTRCPPRGPSAGGCVGSASTASPTPTARRERRSSSTGRSSSFASSPPISAPGPHSRQCARRSVDTTMGFTPSRVL